MAARLDIILCGSCLDLKTFISSLIFSFSYCYCCCKLFRAAAGLDISFIYFYPVQIVQYSTHILDLSSVENWR